MALPIDIPSYSEDLTLRPVKGNTTWGYYDEDQVFVADAKKFANYAYRKLGGIMEDVELNDLHYYTSFEDAVNTFGKELYEYKIRENYLNLEGAPTGSQSLNNTLIQPNLGTVIRLAQDYGSEAGSGGNINYYTGSFVATPYVQDYDLNAWAEASASLSPGDQIEVKRVFYEVPPAITRFFDPTVASGIGYESLLTSFGFDKMSPAVNYMMMPIYFDVMRVQSIEMNDTVRRSSYTFEIQNNKLKIFPIPVWQRVIHFHYIKQSERNAISRTTSQGQITNVSNVPFDPPTYSQINSVFKKWIFDYGVAVCREILGGIRGRYQSIPIPGNDSSVSLNGAALAAQSDADKDKLLLQLRDTLNASSRQKQLEMKAAEAQSMQAVMINSPLMIYVG